MPTPVLNMNHNTTTRMRKVVDHLSMTTSSASLISAVQHRRSAQQLAPFLHHSTRFPASSEEDNIDTVREKLMLDLRTEMDKIKNELLKEDDEAEEEERKMRRAAVAGQREEDEAVETRPWNLRTQRAACSVPAAKNSSSMRKECAEEEKVAVDKEKKREKLKRR